MGGRSRWVLFALLAILALPAGPARSQEPVGPVDVVQVEGPLDGSAVRFAERMIRRAADGGSQAVVLQLDAPAALTSEIDDLLDLVADPPLPVAVWVGPGEAVAYGGAGQLLVAARLRSAAPGSRIGYLWPTVAGERGVGPEVVAGRFPDLPVELLTGVVEVTGPVPGLLAERDLVPSIGQVVVGLDGRRVEVRGEARTLATAREVEGRVEPAVPVRFHKPTLATRLLRLAVRPEAAFFFLVTGAAVIAFEFYALGPGVAGAVGLAGVLLGGYGLAVLPLTWWALALVLAGLALLTVDVQRGGPGPTAGAGLAALVVGGLRLTDGAPQLVPAWWGVLLTVAAIGLFYAVAVPTVIRARFSTPTIGRDHLVGRTGTAATDLRPDGVVVVGEARWRATSHREAAIGAGDPVRVVGVRGISLRVEPESARED